MLTVMAVVSLAAAAAPASAASAPTGSAAFQRTTPAATTSDVTTQSTTDGSQYAKPGYPTSGDVDYYCNYAGYVVACFQRYGDVIWVYNSDGVTRRAHYSNWLWDGSDWTFWRNGDCVTYFSGWGYCNKDFYEDSSLNAFGSHGSGVRVFACDYECDTGYVWVRNNQ